jgi:hypothetical protein
MTSIDEQHKIRIDKVDRDLTLYHWSKIALAIAAVILIGIVVTIQFVTLSSVQNSTDRIQSCIDPKGACYKSGDRRSSAVVKLLNDSQEKIVTAAAFCAKQPGNTTLQQIEDCTNKELKK